MTFELDRSSPIPLYKQLKKGLIDYIQFHLQKGEAMPTESEIESMFQVSRITVRRAIEELEVDGIVIKQQGRGTFVRSKEIIQEVDGVTSWTKEMKKKGRRTKTLGLELVEIKPSRRLIHDLQLNQRESVIRLKRVRCVDEEPIAIMVSYLRSSLVPNFLHEGLTNESLYVDLEEKYGLIIERATEWIRAREATDIEASILQIPPYSAVLALRRLSVVRDIPFELVEMIARADRYQYTIELLGESKRKVIEDH